MSSVNLEIPLAPSTILFYSPISWPFIILPRSPRPSTSSFPCISPLSSLPVLCGYIASCSDFVRCQVSLSTHPLLLHSTSILFLLVGCFLLQCGVCFKKKKKVITLFCCEGQEINIGCNIYIKA